MSRKLCLLLLLSIAVAVAAPVRVLIVTGGHTYDTSFYTLFEDNPNIQGTVDPHPMPYRRGDLRPHYDVLVLYDSMQEIDDQERKNLTAFVEGGKGVVLLHHALVDYSDWQWWYEEVVGARWLKSQSKPLKWKTTWKHDVDIEAYPAKDHPIVEGIGKFTVNDETYKGMWFSPDVTVLLKTDHPTSDGPLVWISPYKKSRVVSIELGHGRAAHLHPSYKRLVQNAILWAGGKK
ncbi:MAG: ThuA domain-containing protein [Bryobacteraceae bacterium]|nr:ThuA domain-containing protein [Bryobacteraceae bacterium]